MIPDYLVSFDTNYIPVEEIDYLIIGGGIAGLRAALELKDFKTVVMYKNGLPETSTYAAQGGIAAALDEGDTPQRHAEDTLAAGAGLNNPEAVRLLVTEGVERVRELMDIGLQFDRADGLLHFTREGGHSDHRILHADGDATGKKIAEFLSRLVASHQNIRALQHCCLIDLISREGTVTGALVFDMNRNTCFVMRARAVILASGGAGQLFQETTNPVAITGDGQAAAFRRGAELADLEFFQFHPTTLYIAGAPRFLISEAARGEGGVLKNAHGDRFMSGYHPSADLAPRDVVARAIVDQMKKTGANCVYLDLTHLPSSLIKQRFPTILEFCRTYGLNIIKQVIPVRPSAHYFMGGVRTDLWGETSLANLFACGEVACNGVHGANRLASNSLLEGLVFAVRAAVKIKEKNIAHTPSFRVQYRFPQRGDIFIDREDLKRSIKSLMWRNVGIERNDESLLAAKTKLENWEQYAFLKEFNEKTGFESQNMLILAGLMAKAALMRKESRGTHYRTDYPETDDKNWKKHLVLTRHSSVVRSKL